MDGVGDGQVGSSGPPRGLAAGGGEDVRLTWLIHDMQIWRIDRIHLTGADGMWIETVVDRGGDELVRRSRPPGTGPPTRTGCWPPCPPPGCWVTPPSPRPARPTPAADEAEATVPTPATPFPALIAAGLGGLVLGAAGALVAMQVRRRTPAERPERVTLSG